jgi:hypothetical protein
VKQVPRTASGSSGDAEIQKLASQNQQEEAQGKGKGQVLQIANGSSSDAEILGREKKLATQNRQEEAQGKGNQVSLTPNSSLSAMPFLPTNRNADADQSSLNVTTIPTHTLPGSDSVRPREKTKSSLTDPNYSKRPSGKSKFSLNSDLCEFC